MSECDFKDLKNTAKLSSPQKIMNVYCHQQIHKCLFFTFCKCWLLWLFIYLLFLCKFNCEEFYFILHVHCPTNIFKCELFFPSYLVNYQILYVLIIKWIIYLRLDNFSVCVAILSLLVNLSCKSSYITSQPHFYYGIYNLKRYLWVFFFPRLEQYYIHISTYIT